MPKLTIDISGRRGLLERHQGDLNDTSAQTNLRYIGEEGQFAEGIFNPTKVFGYLNPANNNFLSLSGTIAGNIVSIQYDAEGDVVYLCEKGENILQLSSLADTSLANYISTTTGYDFQDMMIYEINGYKALVYITDAGADIGTYVGFKSIDPAYGAETIDVNLLEVNTTTAEVQMVDNGTTPGANAGRQLAQSFDSGDLASLEVTGARLRIRRRAGTGVGVTLKVSIQSNATASAGDYTARGAWADATSYAINDTVTYGGNTYACILAHTSVLATNRPTTGTTDYDYWNIFGAPSGTELASGNFDFEDVPVGDNFPSNIYQNLFVAFSAGITLTDNTRYWLVLEEVGTVMTTDRVGWLSTNLSAQGPALAGEFAKGYYPSTNLWKLVSQGSDNNNDNWDTLDFGIVTNRVDNWSSTLAVGFFEENSSGADTFLYLAENGLLYWFIGNSVHTLDGGLTGGDVGRANEEVLSFPSYMSVVDVTETRSRMYIGIQTSEKTIVADNRYYTARECGAFVWDRNSRIFGGTDFYPATGAKEVKKVFKSSNGDVKMISTGNSGFSEIRAINGNQYAVIHTFEQNGYPVSRRAVAQLDGLTIWLGLNGVFYAYGSVAPGEPEQLYKIGTMAAEANAGLSTGAIFVGHEEASEPRSAVLFGWKDADPSYVVQKWYPHGDGTISSVAQKANTGNVYTKVYEFQNPYHVTWAHIYFAPFSGGDTTDVATIKCYINKSATASHTWTVETKDLAKGYMYLPLGEKNVYAIQFEIEWDTTITLGTRDFMPNRIVVDYNDTVSKKK